MTREERIIAGLRNAIALRESDPHRAGQQRAEAQNLFCNHRYSRKFFDLYWELQKIINAATPREVGHYRTTYIGIGYSSFPVHRWTREKEQPIPPTTEELLRRFDALIEAYQNGRSCQLPRKDYLS